jgi:hypothetical protein
MPPSAAIENPMIFLQGNSVKEEKGCSKGVNEMTKPSSLMHLKAPIIVCTLCVELRDY